MQILRMLLAPCVVLGFAAPAFSQQPAEPEPRGYVAVCSGIELETPASTDVMLAAEYAEHVGPGAQAYVTFTYFENLMSADLEDEIAKLGAALSATTGAPWEFRGRDRGTEPHCRCQGRGLAWQHPPALCGGGAVVINLRRTIRKRVLATLQRPCSTTTVSVARRRPTPARRCRWSRS